MLITSQSPKLGHFLTIATVFVLIAGCAKDKPVEDPADASAARQAAQKELRDVEDQESKSAQDQSSKGAMEDAVAIADLPPVYFAFDSANVRKSEIAKIRKVADTLQKFGNVEIRFEGHADDRGSADYNMVLGQRRANSVKELISGYGIDKSRLATRSYGEEFPAERGTSEQAYAKNRRVEFVITKR